MAATIYKTEKVDAGEKAKWPYETGYTEPTKSGYVFEGWEYSGTVYEPPFDDETTNPFGPIEDSTDILAKWIKIKVYCNSDKSSVGYIGEDIEIHYWAEAKNKITSTDVKLKTVFDKTTVSYSIISDTESAGNYRICKIKINENTNVDGKDLVVYAEYKGVKSEEVIVHQKSPYEVEIPDSDYFVFNYSWDKTTNGRDLDSLTVIYVEDRNGNKITKSFTNKGVGYSFGYQVSSSGNMLCLKHGGDNTESGAEGAIVCLSNIVKTGEVSNLEKVKVEIYANWFNTRVDGNMRINCTGYKSKETSTGDYSDDIIEVEHTTSTGKKYNTFEPNTANCDVSWSGFSDVINIKAHGTINTHIENLECAGNIYSHVCTVVFNIATGTKSYIRRTVDNGFDAVTNMIKLMNNDGQVNTWNDLDVNGQHFESLGMYIDYWGDTTYLFDNENDYIEMRWPSGINEDGTRPTIQIKKSDLPVSYTTEDTIFLDNFSIVQRTDKKIDIKFDITNSNGKKRDCDICFYKKYSDCTPLFNRRFSIHQNRNT